MPVLYMPGGSQTASLTPSCWMRRWICRNDSGILFHGQGPTAPVCVLGQVSQKVLSKCWQQSLWWGEGVPVPPGGVTALGVWLPLLSSTFHTPGTVLLLPSQIHTHELCRDPAAKQGQVQLAGPGKAQGHGEPPLPLQEGINSLPKAVAMRSQMQPGTKQVPCRVFLTSEAALCIPTERNLAGRERRVLPTWK